MAENGNGKKISLSHIAVGSGAGGLALVGSLYVGKYQIEDLERRMQAIEQSQVQVIRTQDRSENNTSRIESLEKQLNYFLRRQAPVPTDPHGMAP